MDPPHMGHKTGPEGDFRCDGGICQSFLGIEAEQLMYLLSDSFISQKSVLFLRKQRML